MGSLLFSSTFDAGTDGWAVYNAGILQNDNGRLKFSGALPWSTLKKDLQLKTGKQYRVRFTIDMGNCHNLSVPVYKSDISSWVSLEGSGPVTSSGTYEGTFTATSNSMILLFEMIPAGNPPPDSTGYYWLDNVSIEDIKPYEGGGVSGSDGGYRYGFNGQEKTNEVYGEGNSYTAEFWQYDARLGRRWNIDPIVKIDESPYSTFRNSPVAVIDPSGDDGEPYKVQKGDNLSKIAKRFGTTVSLLAKINGLKDVNKISAGQILTVGSLPSPAAAYGMTPHNDSYEDLNKKPLFVLAVAEASSTALSLYTGSYNTNGSVVPETMNNLTEDQKQRDFATSSPKTTGILMWEFLTGTGKSHRSFDESNPITNEIKGSESSRLTAWNMAGDFQRGNFKDGQTTHYYAGMNEGVSRIESIRRHLNAYFTTPASFYRGGMNYFMTRSGNDVVVKVTDAYTVYSMARIQANIERIPGQTTPVGQTTVEFNFTWKDALKKK